MMRKLFLTCGLIAGIALTSFATTPAIDHPGSLPVLLGLDSVRRELKLDSLQRAVLDSLREEYKVSSRKLTDPMPTAPIQRISAEKDLVKLNERYNKRALSVLNQTQRKRLLQIEHQVLGATALYSPSIQKKVGISAQQKQQIETVRQQGVAYVGRINRQFEDGKINHQERMNLLRSRRLSQATTLLKFLTPEQRDALSALGGSPFSI